MPLLEVTNGPTPPTGYTLAAGTELVIEYARPYSDGLDVYPQVVRGEYDVTNSRWKPEGASDGVKLYIPGAGVGDAVPPSVKIVEKQVYDGAESVVSYRQLAGIYEDQGAAGTWDYASLPVGYQVLVESDVSDLDAQTVLAKLNASSGNAVISGSLDVDGITVDDGGTIGSATTPGAITIASDGGWSTGGSRKPNVFTQIERDNTTDAHLALKNNTPGATGSPQFTTLDLYGFSNRIGGRLKSEDTASSNVYSAVQLSTGRSTFGPEQIRFRLFAGANLVATLHGGDLAVADGNLVIGTSGKGIDFSATSDASGSTSELLDNYEEGTWTATVNAGTINGNSTGYYTKIGDRVFINITVNNLSDRSSSSNIQIVGLPFQSNNSAGDQAMVASTVYIGGGAEEGYVGIVSNATSKIQLFQNRSGTTQLPITHSSIVNTAANRINIAGSYLV